MATAVENPVRGTEGRGEVEVRRGDGLWHFKASESDRSLEIKANKRKKGFSAQDGCSRLSFSGRDEPRNKQANLQDNGVRLILPGGQSTKTTHRVNISWCAMWSALTSTACSRWHCRCDSRTAWWGSGSPAKRGHSVVKINLQPATVLCFARRDWNLSTMPRRGSSPV